MRLVLDVEANGLKPTKIHVVVTKDIDTGIVREFYYARDLRNYLRTRVGLLIAHNGISYDLPVLARLWDIHFEPAVVFDTLVAAQLLDFTREGGHSLEAWGITLGCHKVGASIEDWSSLTPLMLERCRQDVEINEKLYQFLNHALRIVHKDRFAQALHLEFEIARICQDMHSNGFGFNIDEAKALYSELDEKVLGIDRTLAEAFPPTVKTKQLKTKIKETVTPFNPSSPKQIVERLSPFWEPKDKTEKGQPKVNETNLATLKQDAPEGCKRLVERLLLAGRLRALKQWIDAYDETTGRVHAEFRGIGTWTGRMGHRSPNLANIAAPKSIKYKAKDLSDLATAYGRKLRGLWEAAPGKDCWLVGCDADQIQLRVLAHYINDPVFTKALEEGDKKLGTDLHTLHVALLGAQDRENSKTWIYAFCLGAGDGKSGEILGVSRIKGGLKKKEFIERYPGLKRLKESQIIADAGRGCFEGLDGRLVKIPGEDQGSRAHLALAGYLQNGEKCIMGWANREWRRRFKNEGIVYKQVNFVHDEWQTEIYPTNNRLVEWTRPDKTTILVPEQTVQAGTIQAQAIKAAGEAFSLNCEMAGEFRVGNNWLDTH